MAILPIVTYNDPVLRKKAEPVEELDSRLSNFVEDLFETMYNSDGVGLAAPQVGSLKRVFVIDGDAMLEEDEEAFGPTAFINPEIIEKKGDPVVMDEGCLSIPEVRDKVSRPEVIRIRFTDQDFKEREVEVGGWISRIIQHEYDHLDGVLFIDHLSAFRKRMHKKSLEEIDSGLREVDYPVVPKL